MASKAFELEQVLKYRLEVERVRKQEFAAAKRELEQANDQLKQEEAQVEELYREFARRQGDLTSIDEIRWFADYFTRKNEDIKNQRERVETLATILNSRRETLLDATREKKVLETLKEKKAQEFRQEMEKKEQSFMDEIAIQKKGETH